MEITYMANGFHFYQKIFTLEVLSAAAKLVLGILSTGRNPIFPICQNTFLWWSQTLVGSWLAGWEEGGVGSGPVLHQTLYYVRNTFCKYVSMFQRRNFSLKSYTLKMDFMHLTLSLSYKQKQKSLQSFLQFNFHCSILVWPTPANTFSCKSGEKSRISALSVHHYSTQWQYLTWLPGSPVDLLQFMVLLINTHKDLLHPFCIVKRNILEHLHMLSEWGKYMLSGKYSASIFYHIN